jgi:hypothetical protein
MDMPPASRLGNEGDAVDFMDNPTHDKFARYERAEIARMTTNCR